MMTAKHGQSTGRELTALDSDLLQLSMASLTAILSLFIQSGAHQLARRKYIRAELDGTVKFSWKLTQQLSHRRIQACQAQVHQIPAR